MLPDISIRINNLIKSMEKTIAPAIDTDNDLAKEQAALLVSHLKMLDQQWDNAYLYETGSLKNMLHLATLLLKITKNLVDLESEIELLDQSILSVPSSLPMTVSGVNEYTVTLGKAIDGIIHGVFLSAPQKIKAEVTEVVLNYGKCQSSRERVWFQMNSLDPDPKDLASMSAMLNGEVYCFESEGKTEAN